MIETKFEKSIYRSQAYAILPTSAPIWDAKNHVRDVSCTLDLEAKAKAKQMPTNYFLFWDKIDNEKSIFCQKIIFDVRTSVRVERTLSLTKPLLIELFPDLYQYNHFSSQTMRFSKNNYTGCLHAKTQTFKMIANFRVSACKTLQRFENK